MTTSNSTLSGEEEKSSGRRKSEVTVVVGRPTFSSTHHGASAQSVSNAHAHPQLQQLHHQHTHLHQQQQQRPNNTKGATAAVAAHLHHQPNHLFAASFSSFGDVGLMNGHRIFVNISSNSTNISSTNTTTNFNNSSNNNEHHHHQATNSGNSTNSKTTSYLQKSASSARIDEILKDSMDAFHRDGPLVNPLCKVKPGGSRAHKNLHAFGGDPAFSGGSWLVDLPMHDRMSYVCESKGFDYGIFYKIDRSRTGLVPVDSVVAPRVAVDARKISLFVKSSRTLFTRYVVGFGVPGHVFHSGNYE